MEKIKRRRTVVPLLQGNYEADLAELFAKVMQAKRAEEGDDTVGAPLRTGEKPVLQSVEYARQYDALMTKAEDSAVEVTLWAISHDEWSVLADEHPPRDDVPEDLEKGVAAKTFDADKERGLNTKTFPPALLKASLVEPKTKSADVSMADHVAGLVLEGGKILGNLDLSRIHYLKLENAAWFVNVGDDALPKFSLVSYLRQESGSDSTEPSASE